MCATEVHLLTEFLLRQKLVT